MSVARHLNTTQPRTEVDVVADAIVAILDARIVPFTPGMIGRLSMATGLPVADIQRAWELKESGYRPPLPTRRPIVKATDEAVITEAPVPTPQYKRGYHPNSRARNEARRAEKEPVPGKRICSGRCGQLKNLDEFAMKNKRTGQPWAWCKECIRAYQKDRYLSSQKLAKLGSVLRFILEDGDEHAGVICPDCDQPCRIGDEVVVSNAVLHHAEHHVV